MLLVFLMSRTLRSIVLCAFGREISVLYSLYGGMRRGGEMYNPCGIFQRVRVIVAGTVSLAVAWPSGNSKIYNSVSAIERRSGVCKLKVQGIPNP